MTVNDGNTNPTKKNHVLIFPFPAQGHMIPLLDFTHHLSLRGGSSLTITIITTPKNLPFLSPLLSITGTINNIETLILPFPSHPSIPSGVENVQHLPPSSFPKMIHALGDLHAPLRSWITSHPSPPVVIVSDFFLGWTQNLGISRVVFSPSAAITCCIINTNWTNMPEKTEILEFPNLPNCPKYPWYQISSIYRSYIHGDSVWEFVRDSFRENVTSWGLVVNSFSAMESVYLEHLKKEMGHERVWAVGPILPVTNGGGNRGGRSSVSVDHVMSWLDAREDNHVVYVCFGSQAVLTKDQTLALASGLEKSRVHFVWALKDPVEEDLRIFFDGFEDSVSGRGLVIRGWAPQVDVLRHRAVGAFLTHCGWNSVIEAVVAGVLMLTWPMRADQYTDAALVVDELKVGVRACEGPDTVPDSDELARVFADSVSGKQTERIEVVKLRKAAFDAIQERGSSVKDLDGFIEHVVSLGLKK